MMYLQATYTISIVLLAVLFSQDVSALREAKIQQRWNEDDYAAAWNDILDIYANRNDWSDEVLQKISALTESEHHEIDDQGLPRRVPQNPVPPANPPNVVPPPAVPQVPLLPPPVVPQVPVPPPPAVPKVPPPPPPVIPQVPPPPPPVVPQVPPPPPPAVPNVPPPPPPAVPQVPPPVVPQVPIPPPVVPQAPAPPPPAVPQVPLPPPPVVPQVPVPPPPVVPQVPPPPPPAVPQVPPPVVPQVPVPPPVVPQVPAPPPPAVPQLPPPAVPQVPPPPPPVVPQVPAPPPPVIPHVPAPPPPVVPQVPVPPPPAVPQAPVPPPTPPQSNFFYFPPPPAATPPPVTPPTTEPPCDLLFPTTPYVFNPPLTATTPKPVVKPAKLTQLVTVSTEKPGLEFGIETTKPLLENVKKPVKLGLLSAAVATPILAGLLGVAAGIKAQEDMFLPEEATFEFIHPPLIPVPLAGGFGGLATSARGQLNSNVQVGANGLAFPPVIGHLGNDVMSSPNGPSAASFTGQLSNGFTVGALGTAGASSGQTQVGANGLAVSPVTGQLGNNLAFTPNGPFTASFNGQLSNSPSLRALGAAGELLGQTNENFLRSNFPPSPTLTGQFTNNQLTNRVPRNFFAPVTHAGEKVFYRSRFDGFKSSVQEKFTEGTQKYTNLFKKYFFPRPFFPY